MTKSSIPPEGGTYEAQSAPDEAEETRPTPESAGNEPTAPASQESVKNNRKNNKKRRKAKVIVAPAHVQESLPPMQQVHVPFALRTAGEWSWRLIVIAVAVVGVGFALKPVSTLIVAVLLALILAVLLSPICKTLVRKLKFPPVAASLTTVLLSLLAVSGLLFFAGQQIYSQFPNLAESAMEGWERMLEMIEDTPLEITAGTLESMGDQVYNWLKGNSGNVVSGALSVGSTLMEVGVGTVVVLFSLIFFLKDGRRIWQWIVRIFPAHAREALNEAGIRAWVTLGDYARMQIVVALINAIGIMIGTLILRVPFVIPIGVLVFLFSFIPIVGAFLSGVLAVLVALVTVGPFKALIMLGVVILVQQLEGNVFSPLLMSGAVSLHPLVVFLAVMAGSTLFGLVGALFAVPLCAMINTIVLYLSGHDSMPELNQDWYRPGGPPGVLLPSIVESYRKPTKEEPRLTDVELDRMVMEHAGGPENPPVPTPVDAHLSLKLTMVRSRDEHLAHTCRTAGEEDRTCAPSTG